MWGNGRGGGRRCIWGHAPIEECVVVVVVDCDNSVVYGWLIVLLSMLIMLLLS